MSSTLSTRAARRPRARAPSSSSRRRCRRSEVVHPCASSPSRCDRTSPRRNPSNQTSSKDGAPCRASMGWASGHKGLTLLFLDGRSVTSALGGARCRCNSPAARRSWSPTRCGPPRQLLLLVTRRARRSSCVRSGVARYGALPLAVALPARCNNNARFEASNFDGSHV